MLPFKLFLNLVFRQHEINATNNTVTVVTTSVIVTSAPTIAIMVVLTLLVGDISVVSEIDSTVEIMTMKQKLLC